MRTGTIVSNADSGRCNSSHDPSTAPDSEAGICQRNRSHCPRNSRRYPPRARHATGDEPDRIRHRRSHRRQPERHESREGDEGAGADECVDCAGSQTGQGDEEQFERSHRSKSTDRPPSPPRSSAPPPPRTRPLRVKVPSTRRGWCREGRGVRITRISNSDRDGRHEHAVCDGRRSRRDRGRGPTMSSNERASCRRRHIDLCRGASRRCR